MEQCATQTGVKMLTKSFKTAQLAQNDTHEIMVMVVAVVEVVVVVLLLIVVLVVIVMWGPP